MSWRGWCTRRAGRGGARDARSGTRRRPALYFGRGKVEEIGEAARDCGANLFVSDDALSPVQERNLSEALG